jgi:molecular chaperone GrpE
MTQKHPFDPLTDAPAATDPLDPANPEHGADAPPELLESPESVALRHERDNYYDRLLRKTAEFENYRKRIERERREQADQAVVDLLLELLLVVDDFDRALTVEAGEGAAAYRKGIELIHAKLNDLLRKQGVRPIVALGAPFDPNLHQAVMHESSPTHREGEVIGELRRGYTIGDRLLRPAMVKVAKA